MSTTELKNAVDDYLVDPSRTSLYGYPMKNWDVSGLSDFSQVFSAVRNPQMLYFSEDLSGWDVGKATSMASMFEGTVSFTDSMDTLASWDVSRVLTSKCLLDPSNGLFVRLFAFSLIVVYCL